MSQATHLKQALDARALANQFLDWADSERTGLSNLKIQKMLFFTHADFLLETGELLLRDEFQAWDYGPVLPSIYRAFCVSGRQSVKARAKVFDPITAMSEIAVLDVSNTLMSTLRHSYSFYRRIGAVTLSDISHAEKGPWSRARELFDLGLNPDRRIKSEIILRYHQRIQ